jgi:hypothetical protein
MLNNRAVWSTFVDPCVDLAGRITVVLAQRCQVLAECGANFGRLIFFRPFASSLRPRLLGDGRKRIQGILIVVKPDVKIAERKRVVVAEAALPIAN